MLVYRGVKTASCAALWSYEEDQKPLPQKGEYSIVLNGNDVPVAVIETVEVFVAPFNEVSER
jgi:histidinol-phosphate aminotransferase